MLGRFNVHAGDFQKGNDHQWMANIGLVMKVPGKFFREKIKPDQIDAVEIASEESVKRLAGTVGWGLAGSLLLGPVGMLAGLIAGGKGKDVTFVCKLKDGRKFLATSDSKIYTEINAVLFK